MKLKLAIGFMVLLIMAATVFGDHGLLNLVRYKRQEQALANEAEKIKAENDLLRLKIERLRADEGYIERLAREDLGMVKPGELVFQFTEQGKDGDK